MTRLCSVTWRIVLLLTFLAQPVAAGILNLRGGPATVLIRDRETRESQRYAALLLGVSYRTPTTEFALDLPFRWTTDTLDFDSRVWKRKGDWLRPIEHLRYRSASGRFAGGVETFYSWTPGAGYLVRGLTGTAETDYALPGLRAVWSGPRLALEAGTDRLVDPTVEALVMTYRVTGGITLVIEGAVDPQAPVAFSGLSENGRPAADTKRRLSGEAAGVALSLHDGKVLDLAVQAHWGNIDGEARGSGGEVSASIDFTQRYTNRLEMRLGSVNCQDGYIPAWFDGAYPVQRWGTAGLTNIQQSPIGDGGPDRKMALYSLQYLLGDYFSVSGGYDRFDDDTVRRARLDIKLLEENGRGLEARAWSRADDPDVELFSDDAAFFSSVSALYNVLPHYLLKVSYEHSWAYMEDKGAFRPINTILLGVMYDISF